MPIARNGLAFASLSSTTNNFDTASLSPTAPNGTAIVAFGGTVTFTNVSASGGWSVWSRVGGGKYHLDGEETIVGFVASGSTSAGTVRFSIGGSQNATYAIWDVAEWTGLNTTSPYNATNFKFGEGGVSALTLAFPSTLGAGNAGIAGFGEKGGLDLSTPRSGWTETQDGGIGGTAALETQWTTSADTSAGNKWPSTVEAVGLAWELNGAAGTGTTISATLSDHFTPTEALNSTLWLNRLVTEVAGAFNDALTYTVNNAAPVVVTTVERAFRHVRNRVLRLTRPWSRKVR